MAELNTLGAVIKTAYEGEADTNALTDAEKSTIANLGTASPLNVPASGDAAAGEVVKGDDTRLSDARTPTAHNQPASTITDFDSAADARVAAASVGALNNVELTSPANKEVLEFDGTNFVNVISPNFKWVYNPSGGTIPAGTLVHITGSVAGYPIVTVADKDTDTEVSGILFDELGPAGFGNMQAQGTIQELFIDTSAVSAGDPLYLDNAGAFTTTKPTSGNVIHVGVVGIEAASDGSLLLDMPASVVQLDEISGAGTAAASDIGDFAASSHTHTASQITDFAAAWNGRIAVSSIGFFPDVDTIGVADGQILAWSTANGQFKAVNPAAAAGLQDLADDTTPQLGGDLDGQGNAIGGFIVNVLTGVSGTLTAATHSGKLLITSGNVTIPTTTGFNCQIEAGGAHTVTFNGSTTAAMAAGDVMSILVTSPTQIRAGKIAVADQVEFT